MAFDNLLTFIELGFRHILPLGFDHILFIIALFLAASSLRQAALLAGAFTLAHTATLGLSAGGVISVSPALVEPLIAASIVFAGADAFAGGTAPFRRLAAAFIFGLVHGLGFAAMIAGYLSEADFVTGLVGFNIGVELGQLVVLFLAAAVAAAARRILSPERYISLFRRPLGTAIALAGCFWLFERLAATS
jgi:hypothetical protein